LPKYASLDTGSLGYLHAEHKTPVNIRMTAVRRASLIIIVDVTIIIIMLDGIDKYLAGLTTTA